MDKDKKAIKEIEESGILVEYLLHHDLSLDEIKHFSAKYVKKAIEWKRLQFRSAPSTKYEEIS